MISVVLVDDHAVVRSGIRLLLDGQEDIEVVGEAGNAKDALFRARALKPDVILLDVVMPGESGIEVLPRLLTESPETKVLVLSMQDDPNYVREAFAAGAHGYVLKEAADEEVVSAVREIAQGGRYVHPTLGARMVAADAEERAAAEADPLSEREHEVLRLWPRTPPRRPGRLRASPTRETSNSARGPGGAPRRRACARARKRPIQPDRRRCR